MLITDLIEELKTKLKTNGNLEVKILDEDNLTDLVLEERNDVVEIGEGEHVPSPVLAIKRK